MKITSTCLICYTDIYISICIAAHVRYHPDFVDLAIRVPLFALITTNHANVNRNHKNHRHTGTFEVNRSTDCPITHRRRTLYLSSLAEVK